LKFTGIRRTCDDMRLQMKNSPSNMTGESRQQARTILRAWYSCNEGEFLRKLQAASRIRPVLNASALEQEKVEVLKAVVGRLKQCPNALQSQPDPIVSLCIKLLLHLAASLLDVTALPALRLPTRTQFENPQTFQY